MSPRLFLLNFWLRLTVKQVLRRMQDPRRMRRMLERDADRFFLGPPDAHYLTETIRRADGSAMEAVWACRGRPDRRRVILYLHGGAYLAGSPATHRHLGAWLAGEAGVRALLPDYRLAPENPFPAAPDDALCAYRHLLDTGYAAENIAVAGDSAGGGLVFALLHAAGEAGLPMPACAVGFSPWCDMTGKAESLSRNAHRDVMLPASRLGDVVDFYLAGQDVKAPLASPLFGAYPAPPPAQIFCSRAEILLDDGCAMAERLREAGGDVQLQLWPSTPHAWPIFAGRLGEADRAVADAGAFIARHLGRAE